MTTTEIRTEHEEMWRTFFDDNHAALAIVAEMLLRCHAKRLAFNPFRSGHFRAFSIAPGLPAHTSRTRKGTAMAYKETSVGRSHEQSRATRTEGGRRHEYCQNRRFARVGR
jgi:hypothetical protein